MKHLISKFLYSGLLGATMLFSLIGCDSGSELSSNLALDKGIVEANQAYLSHFGSAPEVNSGTAYARVGYFPLKDKPGKVGAMPMFLLTQNDQMVKILENIARNEMMVFGNTPYYNPFPEDFTLDISLNDNIATINIQTTEEWKKEDQKAATLALTETALQFDQVKSVSIMLNGNLVDEMPQHGSMHNENAIVEVGPPKLILIAGVWEGKQKEPEEILIEFDRPVILENFELTHPDGQKVQGDYYQSIFQMAVVVHPEFPEMFQEGTKLKAQWQAIDLLGRSNQGTDTLALIRFNH
jgi:hypothetical protein